MSFPAPTQNTYRLLIVDDTPGIHEDIRKVLARPQLGKLPALEEKILSAKAPNGAFRPSHFEIDSAYQGEEALELVRKARSENRPYALVFLDMRMPPGIDGRETLKRLWRVDAELPVVICTAFSDYSWEEIAKTTGPTDRVVILRKPFEPIEIMQVAHTLTQKWRSDRETKMRVAELENLVSKRTQELTESQAVFQLIVEETIEGAKRTL